MELYWSIRFKLKFLKQCNLLNLIIYVIFYFSYWKQPLKIGTFWVTCELFFSTYRFPFLKSDLQVTWNSIIVNHVVYHPAKIMDCLAIKSLKNLRCLERKEKTSKAFQNSFLFFPHYIPKHHQPLLMTVHASQFSPNNKCINLRFLSAKFSISLI